jgi:hypothetical protein
MTPLHTVLWLACWGFLILGIWTFADWVADKLTGKRRVVRPVTTKEWKAIVARNAFATDEVADLCVKALERAYEAMRDDPKLAEREVEWVLEQIDAA